MGNSTSKTSRVLGKTIKQSNSPLNKLQKQVTDDHLKASQGTLDKTKLTLGPQIFTDRPPKELEKNGEEGNVKNEYGNKLFEEAVFKGVVNVNEHISKHNFDPNHESLQVLKNRAAVEKQYDGLFIPKDADKPNTPDRFLTEEQRRKVHDPEFMKKKLQKTGSNAYGLFDSKNLSDLIADYKVFGEEKLKQMSKEEKVGEANMYKLKKLIDEGLINLPTHKVTLQESIDPESKKVKQKLIVVKDDWVQTIKEDMEREKNSTVGTKTTSKKDQEVFEQFKMLESLVSKSQIQERKSEGPTEETEVVMNRPRKRVGKEIKTLV